MEGGVGNPQNLGESHYKSTTTLRKWSDERGSCIYVEVFTTHKISASVMNLN